MRSATITKKSIKDRLLYKGVLMVEIDIEYPEISGMVPESGRKAFNRHYQQEADEKAKYGRGKLYRDAVQQYEYALSNGYPFNNYTLMQRYEVTFNYLPLVSLYYDVYEYTGGAHGNTIRTGNTWDVFKGKMLTMGDLFKRGYDYVPVILRYIKMEALRRQATGEGMFFDNLMQNIEQYFDQVNFYLTKAGLAVFYPLYTISPYAGGINVFEVPYGLFGRNLVYPLIVFP